MRDGVGLMLAGWSPVAIAVAANDAALRRRTRMLPSRLAAIASRSTGSPSAGWMSVYDRAC